MVQRSNGGDCEATPPVRDADDRTDFSGGEWLT
jgi:hypothetical protein